MEENQDAVSNRHNNPVESLRVSDAHYRTLVEAAQEGIGMVNLDENIVFVNQAFADMLGYQKADLVGLNLRALTDEAEFAGYLKETQVRREGKSSRYETVLRRKTGEPMFLSLSASPLQDDRGNICGTMGLLMDITERKQAESEREITIELLRLLTRKTAAMS